MACFSPLLNNLLLLSFKVRFFILILVPIFFIITVLCTQFRTEGNAVPEGLRNLVRLKRNDLEDRWSWGYAETTTESPNKPKDINSTLTPAESPCNPYKPSVPNFWSPGRRLSEAKCDEYIWQVRFRHLKEVRERQCSEYIFLKQHPIGFQPPTTIIGGHNTEPGEYPHMGALGWKASGGGTWVFKCGSALISPKFLLTAAHCSRTSSTDTSVADPVPKIVRLGDKNIADVLYRFHLPKDENISRIIVHSMYSPPKKYNDIAIIELTREVEFTKLIQPACLYTKFDTSSLGKVTLTGWGVIETTNLRTSPELQAAEVDIIDSAVCSNLLNRYCSRRWCGVQDGQICAGKLAGGVDSCQGDSGGPLQVKIPLNITVQGSLHYLIGVTSFGIGCALPNKPGLYTRVSNYIDWIERTVWPY